MDATKTQRRKPSTVSVALGSRLFGVSRSVGYEQVKETGELAGVKAIRVGSRWRLPTVALERELGIDLLDFVSDDELAADGPTTIGLDPQVAVPVRGATPAAEKERRPVPSTPQTKELN
jgi:hypothetical protein